MVDTGAGPPLQVVVTTLAFVAAMVTLPWSVHPRARFDHVVATSMRMCLPLVPILEVALSFDNISLTAVQQQLRLPFPLPLTILVLWMWR
jgi:NADH:ubiquinone oxidoreductase subunit H